MNLCEWDIQTGMNDKIDVKLQILFFCVVHALYAPVQYVWEVYKVKFSVTLNSVRRWLSFGKDISHTRKNFTEIN